MTEWSARGSWGSMVDLRIFADLPVHRSAMDPCRTSKSRWQKGWLGSDSYCPCAASTLLPLISRNSSAMTAGPLSMGFPEPLKIRPGRNKECRKMSVLPASARPPAPTPLQHLITLYPLPPQSPATADKAFWSHPVHWPGPRLITYQRIRLSKEGLSHSFQPAPAMT